MISINLHAAVPADYRDFLRSCLLVAMYAHQFPDRALEEESRLLPELLLQLGAAGATVEVLAISATTRTLRADRSYRGQTARP